MGQRGLTAGKDEKPAKAPMIGGEVEIDFYLQARLATPSPAAGK